MCIRDRYNNIICQFQDGFVDVARMYYKKTGRELDFVPLYVAPALKKMYIGKPVRFDASAPIKEEKERICRLLAEEITDIARRLPPHRVCLLYTSGPGLRISSVSRPASLRRVLRSRDYIRW